MKKGEKRERKKKEKQKIQLEEYVKNIPEDSPKEELKKFIDEIISQIKSSVIDERTLVREAISIFSKQPKLVDALIERYNSQSEKNFKKGFQERFQILQIIGEIKRPETLKFLRSELWKPLPPKQDKKVDSKVRTDRDYEEIIKAKIVNGIAYLNTEETDQELKNVMLKHESISIRIEAIKSYIWNKKNEKKEIEGLLTLLPPEYHPYVDRPIFHRNMNSIKFNYAMANWVKKWGKKGKLPKNPKIMAEKRNQRRK